VEDPNGRYLDGVDDEAAAIAEGTEFGKMRVRGRRLVHSASAGAPHTTVL